MKCPNCDKEIEKFSPAPRSGWVFGFCDCTPGRAVVRTQRTVEVDKSKERKKSSKEQG